MRMPNCRRTSWMSWLRPSASVTSSRLCSPAWRTNLIAAAPLRRPPAYEPRRDAASCSGVTVPRTSTAYVFATPYLGCVRYCVRSPSLVISTRPVLSTSSRPTQ